MILYNDVTPTSNKYLTFPTRPPSNNCLPVQITVTSRADQQRQPIANAQPKKGTS